MQTQHLHIFAYTCTQACERIHTHNLHIFTYTLTQAHKHTIYRSSHTHAHKYTNYKNVINPSSCNSPFHDGSHIDPPIATFVALTHNTDTQEIYSVWKNTTTNFIIKKLNYYYWSLLYSAVRCCADSLHSHVTLHEWTAFYSAVLNIHWSGVFTALAWQCNQHLKTKTKQLHHLLHSISL